jgi:choline dehydrogenase-like flavoprotein
LHLGQSAALPLFASGINRRSMSLIAVSRGPSDAHKSHQFALKRLGRQVMIRDLFQAPRDVSLCADVAIVGAGIAGLVLADRLRKASKRVVVLESGSHEQTAPEHPLNQVENLGRPYRGATASRFRCLGGTSTRWGGALIPFIASDLEARPRLGLPSWPLSYEAIAPYVRDVERLFRLDESGYDESLVKEFRAENEIPIGDRDLSTRFAKWPRFDRRNVATLLGDAITKDPALEIWLNATTTDISIDQERGLARGVVACAPNLRKISVTAPQIAVCAGAIETTRLLLVLDRANDNRVFSGCDSLGCYFQDHVSGAVGEIRASDPAAINRLAGFRFHKGAMRSFRLELTPSAQHEEGVGSAFVHIAARPLRPTGFDALREFLRSVQRRRPAIGKLARAALDAPYLMRAAQWRYGRRQLFWPQPSAYDIHVVAEQLPDRGNQIGLSRRTDPYGIPLATISWSIREPERRIFAATMRRFAAYWSRHALSRFGYPIWRTPPERLALDDLEDTGDIAHPMGSTRMGASPRTSVLNGELAVHAVRNVWVASTSAFPSGSSANPTMMLAMLTLRLGDQLGRSS